MWKSMTYRSISSIFLEDAAKELWLKFEILSKDKNLFIISWNDKEVMFKSTDFWWNTSLGMRLSNDKELTYKILERHNLPIARSYYLNKEDLLDFNFSVLRDFKFPVIIKPISEGHGHGVMMNILNIDELKEKLEQSFWTYSDMIIQEQISWEEVRVVVVKWSVVCAVNRIPATIVGDGTKNIKDLIEHENHTNELRWEGYEKKLAFIEIDDELISYIEKNGLDLDTVPKEWEEIQLRWNSNLWTGGTAIDVTNEISEDIKKICIEASKIFWLEICWVDILSSDTTKPLSQTWWVILEINATPWIWYQDPENWVNIWKEILKKLFF